MTYALHHLEDNAKAEFIKKTLGYLEEGGAIIIGDIAFETPEAQGVCLVSSGDDWDDEEFYIVWLDFAQRLEGFCHVEYKQVSHCGGVLIVRKK